MASDKPRSAGITIERLGIAFGRTRVLDGIDLAIEPGEFFAFLGPSGSGKSTLLRAIAGFGPEPQGRVLIGDEDVTRMPPWTRNVGMVFQSYALWPHMTVRRNVAFGLEERRVPAPEIVRRVDAALDLVGLRDYAERRPNQLSGGQQQRVALARTVVVEPRVLLLDEPLSNLDANLRIQMRRELHDLQRKLGLTTIFVTHDQEEANTVADRMAVLDQGILQQVGSPMALYDHPVNRFVAAFLGTANMIDGKVEGGRFAGPGGIRVPLPGGAADGAGRTLMFRPQNLLLRPPAEPAADGRVRLDGRIEHREFLGSLIRYSVEVGQTRVLADDAHQVGHRAYDVGAPIALYLDAAQARVLDA